MTAPGSLVGFALAFLVVAWATSTAALLLHGALRARLSAAGPATERLTAAFGLVAPPLLAFIAVTSVALAPLSSVDHCEGHGHHLHLCLTHGAEWATRPVAVAMVAGCATLLVLAACTGAAGIVRTRRTLRALRRGGETRCIEGIDVVIVPFERRLSFTAGLVRPSVYVSTAVWSRLDDDERRALLAHELAHARGRDVLWTLVLSTAVHLGAPRLARRLESRWRAATERLRDQDAAHAVGDPALVGAALVSVARVPAAPSLAGTMDASGDDDLVARVDALLGGGPDGTYAARRLMRAGTAAITIVAVALVIWSEPVHHGLETLLAVF